jgi:alcohol dehydrogenase class IV
MDSFRYYQPTEIHFGRGQIEKIAGLGLRFGKRCLLVTTSTVPDLEPMFKKVKEILGSGGLDVAHFDGIQPNPTTDNISAGARLAVDHQAEVIIGLGGGSAMDGAKAIAVEAVHEGTAWDYLFYRETQPTDKTLPVIAVSTTSGTGSQVTQVAVLTNTGDRDKSAIYNSAVFPRACIVDPELMVTLPKHVTAATGFDAFCHAFESMLHPQSSPLTHMLALSAIQMVVTYLPDVLENLSDPESRTKLALADTYAGLCIANAGVTLPHGMGMAISGMYPHVAHGESLAAVYPAFTRFTWSSAIKPFAAVGRILDPGLRTVSDEQAAERSCTLIDAFLDKIGLTKTLKACSMPEEEIEDLAVQSMVLPDYKANPKVASAEEMLELIRDAFTGKK